MTAITARLRDVRRRIAAPKHDQVHFHIDGAGRAFVCDVHACDSVPLTLDEAERAGHSTIL